MKQAITKKLIVSMLVFISGVSLAGVTSWYEFEGDLTDSAGTNHGTGVGGIGTIVDATRGNVASFDGVDDYINLGNDTSLDMPGVSSVAMWVKFNTKNAGWIAMYTKGTLGAGTRLLTYGTWHANEGPYYGNGVDGTFWPVGEFDDGAWHHIAGTNTGTELKVYLDGVNIFSSSAGSTGGVNTVDATIGWDLSATADDYYTGLMDDVAIWSGTYLTANMVQALYDGTATPLTVGNLWGNPFAENPYPTFNQKGLAVNTALSWDIETAFISGLTSTIYLGKDPDFPEGPVEEDYSPSSYTPPADLDAATCYYWQIDLVDPNLGGDPIVYQGDTWQFCTTGYWPRETLVEWTHESLAQVEKDHRIMNSYYYYENQNRSSQSFTWGLGMEMRALAQAARIDPYRYTGRLENLADAVKSAYWDPATNGIGGFSVLPAPFSQYYRYTDENTWLSYSYAKTYRITNDPDHLQTAKDSLAFALNLENTTYSDGNIALGGLWWKETFDVWCPQIAAVSTSSAALASLEIYSITGESFYLTEGIRLLDWLTDNMQDSDDVFWDSYHTEVCTDSFGSHQVGIRGWKWSVDTAIPMHAFALLYELTGDPAYLAEAELIASAVEDRWVDPVTGTINDPSYFAFTAIEGWLCLYRQTGNEHWLDLTTSVLGFVHDNTRDANGRYPEFWNQTPSSPYTSWQFHWTTAQPCAYAAAAALYGKTVVPEIEINSANITASASSTQWGSANETINGSGLNNFDHSNSYPDMWTSAAGGGGGSNPHPGTESGAAWLKYEFDQSYPLGTMWVWNHNQSGASNRGLRWITIEYTNDGSTWTKLGEYEIPQAPGTENYPHNFEVDFGGVNASAVVITAHSSNGNWGSSNYGLSEIRFGTYGSRIYSFGDLDRNGIVDINDLGLFAKSWLSIDGNSDFDNDGFVDLLDFPYFQ